MRIGVKELWNLIKYTQNSSKKQALRESTYSKVINEVIAQTENYII